MPDDRPRRSPAPRRGPRWTHARIPRHRGPPPHEAVRHRQARGGRRVVRHPPRRDLRPARPNGAGKTTTVEILEGYRTRTAARSGARPRSGPHEPQPQRTHRHRPADQRGIAERHRGRAAPALHDVLPEHRSVEELLNATGIETQRNTRISRLSGGQRRRVDVALGIIGRPEVLFLDEPTTGFDPEAAPQFWDLIDEVKREGTTILLTTHYLDEAAHLADRAAVIADGTLLDIAPIDEIGGAEARTPRVRWRDDAGQHHEQRTHEPTALIRSTPDPMHALEVIRPSLEDVYLGMVGTR